MNIKYYTHRVYKFLVTSSSPFQPCPERLERSSDILMTPTDNNKEATRPFPEVIIGPTKETRYFYSSYLILTKAFYSSIS